MLLKHGIVLAGILFFFSCSDKPAKDAPSAKTDVADPNQRLAKNFLTDCKKLSAAARYSDSILLGQTDIDKVSANNAIKAFTDFAFYCKSDSMAPVYLIKTAQVARAINNIPQAKTVLDECIESHRSFKNRPAALFLLAQLYDDDTYLNDEAEAKRLYEQIINEYPKSDWAISAKGAINFLGKSDEQILKELKRKNK